MPSFDITSEVDLVALRNAVEGANRKITGRYDFKGSDARVEQNDKILTLHGDSNFQLEQIIALLLPEMTGKKIDVRCLKHGDVQKVGGNKVKQDLTVRVGVEQELAKKIVKQLKDSKLKVQASIQGTRCGSPGPSGMCSRRPSPWCARKSRTILYSTETSGTETNMDAAAAISANSLAMIQAQASVLVLKKSLDLQASLALQLLEALPQPEVAPDPTATVGGRIDTYA